ncbi:MAG: tol-pal system protein YbgF [Rhodospirillales bacterium]|nr:tol-pal system protein YbgF [Rhodospirillales bacterium]MCB9994970.1 tol-pal system protein YbgF [Rhodospirillales bacterium]
MVHRKISKKFLTLFTATLCAACVAAPAFAQDTNARLSRIENELQTLSRAVFRGETPPPGSLGGSLSTGTANTELRLQQIETEIRTLTGRVEEQSFEDRQFRESMEQRLSDLEQRLSAIEMNGGIAGGTPMQMGQQGGGMPAGNNMSVGGALTAPAQTPYPYDTEIDGLRPGDTAEPPQPGYTNMDDDVPSSMGQLGVLRQSGEQASTYLPAPADIANDPAGLYERAFSFIRDRDYGQAEGAFAEFLNRYPDHDLAANAQYWLGETYYVRNDFDKAARVFAEAYQKYPKGPKGPDNLLKLGMSLSGLGKTQEACVAYAQLKKEYPSQSVPVLMRAEQEMERLKCAPF